jgi:hypothetical protein
MKQLMFPMVLPRTNAVFSAQTQNTAVFGRTQSLLSEERSRRPIPKKRGVQTYSVAILNEAYKSHLSGRAINLNICNSIIFEQP